MWRYTVKETQDLRPHAKYIFSYYFRFLMLPSFISRSPFGLSTDSFAGVQGRLLAHHSTVIGTAPSLND